MPSRPLVLPGEASQLLDSESGLQEEIYSWRLREDVFAGISDEKTRKKLRTRLIEKLADSQPPSERCLAVLKEFVEAAEEAIKSDDGVVPTLRESLSDEDHDNGNQSAVGINALHALTMHLKWLLACFENQPGITVSVR